MNTIETQKVTVQWLWQRVIGTSTSDCLTHKLKNMMKWKWQIHSKEESLQRTPPRMHTYSHVILERENKQTRRSLDTSPGNEISDDSGYRFQSNSWNYIYIQIKTFERVVEEAYKLKKKYIDNSRKLIKIAYQIPVHKRNTMNGKWKTANYGNR